MRSIDSSDALTCASKHIIDLQEEKAILTKFEFTGALTKLRKILLVARCR